MRLNAQLVDGVIVILGVSIAGSIWTMPNDGWGWWLIRIGVSAIGNAIIVLRMSHWRRMAQSEQTLNAISGRKEPRVSPAPLWPKPPPPPPPPPPRPRRPREEHERIAWRVLNARLLANIPTTRDEVIAIFHGQGVPVDPLAIEVACDCAAPDET